MLAKIALSKTTLVLIVIFCWLLNVQMSDAKPKTNLSDLSFISGLWKGTTSNGSIVEEYWSLPEGDSMVGHCRFITNGKATFYELLTIVQRDDGIYLTMKHFDKNLRGWSEAQEAGDCLLTRSGDNEAVFSNNNANHLVTVIYKKKTDGDLSAIVEDTSDGKKQTFDFTYHR